MSNYEIARIFTRMADLMEVQGENAFKIRAYRKATDTIEGLTESLESIAARGALETVPNVGKGIAGKIEEIVRTGTTGELEELRAKVPEGLPELLNISGLGPKKVQVFYQERGIGSLDELERAAREQKLRDLPGMGAKSEERILEGIEGYRRRSERWPIGRALPYAESLVAALRAVPGVDRVEIAGSLRRMRDTLGDLDLVGAAVDPRPVMEAFLALPQAKETLLSGDTRSSIVTHEGIQVDLRLVQPEAFVPLLHHFTGSRDHNIRLREMAETRGLKINEYGIFRAEDERPTTHDNEFRPTTNDGSDRSVGSVRSGTGSLQTEADLYSALDLPFIAPELREDRGEIEAAREGRLPNLIEIGDVKGNLHGHSDWSDGATTIEVMVETARALGHAYIAITDHSKALGVAGGLDEERLRRQMAVIDALNERLAPTGFRVLKGIEVDILVDGALDLDHGVLNDLDIVIGSVHSHFRQDEETKTARMIRAMESGCVDVLGHPTGRLLGYRDPYPVNVERLIDAAVATGTALEINSHPERLDLNDIYARRARDRGVLISINTDAHHPSHFQLLRYGIGTARRAWLTAEDVLNTWPLDRLERWLRTRER